MRKYARYSIVAIGISCFAPPVGELSAQTISAPSLGVPAEFDPFGEAIPVEAAGRVVAAQAGGESAAQPKAKTRLERLTQLTFDRRPAAVLKAWAEANGLKKPEPAKPALEPKKTKKPDDNSKPAKADEPEKPAPWEAEVARFQSDVTLGRWPEVKKYLAGLPKEEQAVAWRQLLTSLASPPSQRGHSGAPDESNTWTADDYLALIASRPVDLDQPAIESLGQILAAALERDLAVEAVTARLTAALQDKGPAAQPVLARLEVARLLHAARRTLEASAFLPPLDETLADGDAETLHLLSAVFETRHEHDGKAADLDRAWQANLAILELKDVKEDARVRALKRAIELGPEVRTELGQAWLDESFVQHAERGVEILATLGELVAQGFEQQPHGPVARLQALTLQNTAVAALLKNNPERARQWQPTLRLLALNWLREAEYSQANESGDTSRQLQTDQFGNVYYAPGQRMVQHRSNQPSPISSESLLEQTPSADLIALLDPGVIVPIVAARAQLLLKLKREEQAFPLIEQLAPDYPERAQQLSEEFLRVWKQNHDPNNRPERYMNPFYFYYGFNERAQSIPLTRSKQERNLVELAGWVERLRQLPLKKFNEQLVAEAFTACHSSAEVYQLEAITRVFGPLEKLEPKTLGAVAQQMRLNLAGLWRAPKVQEAAKTRRKTKDIQAEVLRGYGVAQDVVKQGLAGYPNEWSLHLAQAAIELDESNFRQELSKDPSFQERRQRAMAGFAKAAELYMAAAPQLPQEEESVQVFQQWFYASLGACDLESVDDDKQPDPKQAVLVRDKLASLPGKLGERHRDQFAAQLFTHLRSVKPAIKFRYLREGFAIVGDHRLAHDARQTYDYYRDLVAELKLDAVIDDGPVSDAAAGGVVGHKQPFGVLVNLRHTPELERESGGFGRFLQNQTTAQFAFNYGRPPVDYRDRFSTVVQESLRENFEVLSITFQTDKVHSKELPRSDWRVTPYAYLLLKARGPHVDKLPPLRLDVDFLDSAGYVVLPIESAAVPLDAQPERGPARDVEKLAVTQILDERQAGEGKLLVEVKASARGLTPDLADVLDLDFPGFRVGNVEDRGVAVTKYDDECPRVAILSERSWLVSLDATSGAVPRDTPFEFAAARLPQTDMAWQRYQDADLQSVERRVLLQSQYGRREFPWQWLVAAAVSAAALVVAAVIFIRALRRKPLTPAYVLPQPLTPFTVLGLLEELRKSSQFPETRSADLARAMGDLETRYFAGDSHSNGDLQTIAEHWLREADAHRRRRK